MIAGSDATDSGLTQRKQSALAGVVKVTAGLLSMNTLPSLTSGAHAPAVHVNST